jgi:hypothetical protein
VVAALRVLDQLSMVDLSRLTVHLDYAARAVIASLQ